VGIVTVTPRVLPDPEPTSIDEALASILDLPPISRLGIGGKNASLNQSAFPVRNADLPVMLMIHPESYGNYMRSGPFCLLCDCTWVEKSHAENP